MGKASWYPELPAILVAELDRNVPTKCGAADAHIDCHVQNRPLQHSHQFALRPGILDVQAAQDIARRTRQIILDEAGGNAGGAVSVSMVNFRKKPTAVAKQFWFNNQ